MPTSQPRMSAPDSLASWQARLALDGRRVFVLDDDPTGTQTTSGTDVLFDANVADLSKFLRSGDRGIHILTNTRAVSPAEAVARIESAVEAIRVVCDSHPGAEAALILRGDSTLRGHIFDEIDAVGGNDHVVLFVPSLPQAGRVTIGGIQWVIRGESAVPVRETEYAADPVFGYQSESLTDWVQEVGGRKGHSLELTDLRSEGSALVTEELQRLKPGEVLIPDAVSIPDLRMIAEGLLDAEEAGLEVVVRSAAAFASVRYGAPERNAQQDLVAMLPPNPAVLVVCGSHTTSSTRQLANLTAATGAEVRFMNTSIALGSGGGLESLARGVAADLKQGGIAILATERQLKAEHSGLEDGVKVMAALMNVVELVADQADLVVSKGGITSASVAPAAWGAARAHVLGQLQDGIPVWSVVKPGGQQVAQVVVAGNVGGASTLTDLVSLARAEGPKKTHG